MLILACSAVNVTHVTNTLGFQCAGACTVLYSPQNSVTDFCIVEKFQTELLKAVSFNTCIIHPYRNYHHTKCNFCLWFVIGVIVLSVKFGIVKECLFFSSYFLK